MEISRDLLKDQTAIWMYFLLLLFEGVLRKWVVPSLSNVLLVVRDPVVLLIYFLSFRAQIFPRNYFLLFGGWLALLCLVAGLVAPGNTLSVALFGFRANFLHLSLVFYYPPSLWRTRRQRDRPMGFVAHASHGVSYGAAISSWPRGMA
jgi:hypothetical protein